MIPFGEVASIASNIWFFFGCFVVFLFSVLYMSSRVSPEKSIVLSSVGALVSLPFLVVFIYSVNLRGYMDQMNELEKSGKWIGRYCEVEMANEALRSMKKTGLPDLFVDVFKKWSPWDKDSETVKEVVESCNAFKRKIDENGVQCDVAIPLEYHSLVRDSDMQGIFVISPNGEYIVPAKGVTTKMGKEEFLKAANAYLQKLKVRYENLSTWKK